ncbi:MAG: Hpt domain-containing protein [Acidiferrobacterales bacterium]
MSTSSQVDPNTLGWVKAEIDETLNQARQALEGFAEDTSDKTRLRFCITHLHQVVGTLMMVELDGAAMLAQETEYLTEAIYNGEVEDENAALESVTRGIIAIPDYLSRLQFGQPDIPLRLLPYINELRLARGEDPLSESELFYPDLSVRPVEDTSEQLEPDEFVENTKNLRKPLQNALLAWLRNESDPAPLKKIESVFEKIEKTAYSPIVEQLFWVAGGFVEALAEGGLNPTNERKRLFARIDQEIKKLIDNSGKPAVRSVFETLLKDLLLEVGRAANKGQKVKTLKQAFSLDRLMPVSEEGEVSSADLPTPEALQSVSAALTEEINSAQDILAAYFDRDRDEDASLEPLIPILTKMSSTMEMLDVTPLKGLVDELTEVCKAIGEGRIENLEDASMKMARGLLVVAQGTEEMGDSMSDWKRGVDDATIMLRLLHNPDAAQPGTEGFEVSDGELSDNEYRQLVGVVGEEVRVNLGHIEEALETYAADDTLTNELEKINAYLLQIEGAVQILGQEELAALTSRTIDAISELLHGNLTSSPKTLEALAVAVGTIGAYLDGLQYDRPNVDALLEVADYELRSLAEEAGERAQMQDRSVEAVLTRVADNLDQWMSANGDEALQKRLRSDLLGVVELAESMQQDKIAQIARQMNTLLQFVTEDPSQFTDEIQTTLLQSCSKLADLAGEELQGLDVPSAEGGSQPVAASPPDPEVKEQIVVEEVPAATEDPAPAPLVTPPVVDEEFDEEIMEIFIEDAQECINSIEKHLPLWTLDTANTESLLELRRNFHTLKGSGRMVGVSDVAELAWSIENMLNRIRDGKIAASPQAIEVVTRVSAIIPDMIGRLQGGPGTSEDYASLEQMANDLAEGKTVEVPGMSSPAPVETAAVPESDIPELDDTLLEIYTQEARGHLKTVSDALESCRQSGGCPVVQELVRATHTLRGSARSVGLMFTSDATGNMEKVLIALQEIGQPLSGKYLDYLQRVHDAVSLLVAHLNDRSVDATGLSEEFARLGQELQVELDALPQPGPEGGTGATPAAQETAPAPVEAAPAPVSAPATVYEDIDLELLEIFQEEAVDLLHTMEDSLQRWRANSNDGEAVSSLKRALHTLKGGARMAGAMTMGNLSHVTESLMTEVEAGRVAVSDVMLDMFDEAYDALSTMLDQIQSGQPVTSVEDLLARFDALIKGETPATATAVPQEPESAPAPVEAAPAPATTAPVSVPVATVDEDIDPELLEIFQEEAVDLLHTMEESLQRWRADSSDSEAVGTLKRALHTLKGGARMAGAMTMGNLSHVTESLMTEVEAGRVAVSDVMLDMFDEAYDALSTMLDQIQSGQPVTTVDDLVARFDTLIKGETPAAAVPAPQEPHPAPSVEAAPAPEVKTKPVPDAAAIAAAANAAAANRGDVANVMAQAMAAQAQAQAKQAAEQAGQDRDRRHQVDRRAQPRDDDRRAASAAQIRVRTALLNDLVNYAGEASISRARMEQQVFGFRDNLGELGRSVVRFRDQLRELEIEAEAQIMASNAERAAAEQDGNSHFDPLEFDRFTKLQQLSRSLTEGLHDLGTIHHNLNNYVGEAESVLQQQARQNTDLQEGLMRTRMVGFSTQAARLRAIVRQTAREVGKRVDLEIIGADVEIDRNVLERMIGPFEHMIRNSIDHGIEDAETRKAAGKPGTGKITLSTSQEGSEIVIRFIDDGAGLNVDRIRAKAIERGLMAEDSQMSREEIMQFILVAGFSTAQQVTQLSGRGVGMDVVHSEVKQLGGTMAVDTETGKGTTFTVRLPLTLSITQALMIRMGDSLYAVPINTVANIIEVPVEKLKEAEMGGRSLLNFEDKVYPFMHLGDQLGITIPEIKGKKVPVLLVKAGSREVAMEVEALVGTREVVIKPVSPQVSKLKGISGATILGDGRVVLILDVSGLLIAEEAIQVSHSTGRRSPTRQPTEPASAPASRRPIVMVVDDSLTVRKVTSRTLQKKGIDVLTAKDGVDGLEQLRSGGQRPDVMLVDIEMPRMDGYEFTTQVRADPDLNLIPIIMITSRAGEKHRKRAFELGVNEYMSKPYQEDVLLERIQGFLPAEATFQ